MEWWGTSRPMNAKHLPHAAVLLSVLYLAAPLFAAPPEIIFAAYNLENYLGPEAAEAPGPRRARPKSEASASAVTRIVREIAPDILGVCEMGSPAQFAAFQARLLEAGLEYPEAEYVQAIDTQRHLALLSRYPIVARHSQFNLTYELNGAPRKIERGILDVTIRITDSYDLRLVGVHLKSKLAVPEDEAVIRRHEAEQVRRYIDGILSAELETNLLLYGYFNDHRNEVPIQTIAGPRDAARHLTELPAADSLGDRWTHYWRATDLYSRIDYLFAARGLVHEIAPGKTHIYRGPGWHAA